MRDNKQQDGARPEGDRSRDPRHTAEGHPTGPPDLEEIEDETAVPEELTGRADATNEDLTALFANDSAEHVTDGFRGGSDDDVNVEPTTDADDPADPSTGGLENV